MKTSRALAFTALVFVPAAWAGDLQSDLVGHLVASNNQQYDLRNEARPVAVTGNGNLVNVQGATSTLAVMGNNNTIELDQVDKIVVFGTNNLVIFVRGLSQIDPEVMQSGSGNSISRKPPPPTVKPTTD